MGEIKANGVRLYDELLGQGVPLALVHESWGDATNCQHVLPRLATSFRVLVYDRRGHSRRERPEGRGSVHEDADDLAAMLVSLGVSPPRVVANSYGGNIAVRLAAKRPELLRSLPGHEPSLKATVS